ncbi:MAG: hypothetical protein ACPG4U_10575, partial [Pseudomonadales bacterium]
MRKMYLVITGVVLMGIGLTSCFSHKSVVREGATVAPVEGGKFRNQEVRYNVSASQLWSITKAYFKDDRKSATPAAQIPLQPLAHNELAQDSRDAVYRLGHSSLLVRLEGQYLLLDPVFSERASPVQWAGPKRFH